MSRENLIMNLLKFLEPNGAKILLFLLLLVIAPFPYFVKQEPSGQYEVRWLWGFPPIVALIYNFLPSSLKELNIGIFDIGKVRTTFYWIPTYAFFMFLLSCVSNLIIEKIKARYGVTTFRGFLWRKLEKLETKPLEEVEQPKEAEEKPEEVVIKEEIKPEEKPKEEAEPEVEFEDLGEKKIKEMSNLIKEEEALVKEQKKKLEKYLDVINIKKLKSIGVDVKANKIFCSVCKQWKTIPKDQLTKLIQKHGFDIIWEYKCPDCKGKK